MARPSENQENESSQTAASQQTRSNKGKGKQREMPKTTTAQAMDIISDKSEPEEEESDDDSGRGRRSTQDQEATMEDMYDPNQNPDDKRQLRKELRAQVVEAEDKQRNVADVTALELTEGLQQSEALFNRIKQTQEATLDSRFLLVTAETAAAKARTMRIDKNAFDIDDFVARLRRRVGPGALKGSAAIESDEEAEEELDEDEDEDNLSEKEKERRRGEAWFAMGRLASKYMLRVPTIDFMLGPLEVEVKKRVVKERVKKAKQKVHDNVKVAQLNEEDIERDENETTQMVKQIHDLLQEASEAGVDGKVGVDFFEFIINPLSYGQTVENLFYLSFLLKDGRAALDLESDDYPGAPILYACDPPSDQQRQDAEQAGEAIKKRQIVLEMTMDVWQSAIDAYDLTETMIPKRKAPKATHGKWQG